MWEISHGVVYLKCKINKSLCLKTSTLDLELLNLADNIVAGKEIVISILLTLLKTSVKGRCILRLKPFIVIVVEETRLYLCNSRLITPNFNFVLLVIEKDVSHHD